MKEYRKLDDFECIDHCDFIAKKNEELLFSIPLEVIGMQVTMIKRFFDVEFVGRFIDKEERIF